MSEQHPCDNRGPRIGEDGTRCRRPSGHVGDHATAPEDGFGDVRWSQWAAPMTSAPPTQPPAAPETDVRLTEAEREAVNVAVDEAETCVCCGDDYGSTHVYAAVERIVAERVRVVEGERDAARAEVAEVRYELGDALTTLETALMGTPSNGCAWSVVGAPACHAGTREHSFWCRHCLVRSTAATTARAESAEAAHRALEAEVEALCDAAEWSTEHSLSRTFTGEKFPATVFVSSLRALLGGAR